MKKIILTVLSVFSIGYGYADAISESAPVAISRESAPVELSLTQKNINSNDTYIHAQSYLQNPTMN